MSTLKTFKPVKKEHSIWDVTGIPSRGENLFIALKKGLDYTVYNKISQYSGFDKKQIASAIHLPQTTLIRRAKSGYFNTTESDSFFRFAAVFQAALDLFEGDKLKSSQWLNSSVKGLGDRKPIDMLKTSAESQAVLNLIGRLEHGIFA
ncbi:type II RES/Xre toxin-antitoxin system antitoxin [Thalassotalea piscium]|uniref:Putative toxin-antitoxin system antitoxin component (TIGR02293 family) n=1 Tax=Thalassotalea piscium TaxID=1230533 RepID=A0A7X0NJU5_9GAMM|nr:antitoxin Xre/MbcA/ParS toxin-binding domain-containing protein [Thalassotalea piscium]MBB6544782.1 putative toxin-antitoxin system antitoxin component (TIGR02293 family) [Thalassotalea piscium]